MAAQTTYDQLIAGLLPKAWWKLSDPSFLTVVVDYSGNGWTGTVNGGVALGQDGPINNGGTSASCNGATGYISTSFNPSGYSAFSVVAWVSPAASVTTPQNQTYVANGIWGSSTGQGFALDQPDNQAEFAVGNGSAGLGVVNPTSMAPFHWHMVVGTWDGTTVAYYVDGASVTSGAFSGNIASANGVQIGLNPAKPGSYLDGLIAEVAIFNQTLSSAVVKELFYAATATLVNGVPATFWAATPPRVSWGTAATPETLATSWSAGPPRSEWVTGVWNASNP